MTRSEARDAVEQVARDLEDEYGVSYRWIENMLRFSGRGANGTLKVHDDHVHLDIDLSFLLRNTVGTERIRQEAEQMMDEHFSKTAELPAADADQAEAEDQATSEEA